MNSSISRKYAPYLLLLPAFISISLIIFYPAIQALSMSFFSYRLSRPNDTQFIGFANYLKALKDPVFWISLKNSLIYVICSVGLQFILGFFLALTLKEGRLVQRIIRTVVLIPWVIPGVLGAFMWRWMFNGNYGIINFILKHAGLIQENVPWLSSMQLALPCAILVTVWRGMPFFTITLIAGLQAVPYELQEAARIDGASKWQELVRIILPMIMPVIVTTTLLRIIWTANYVDLLFLLTEGGPGYSSQVLPLYTYTISRNTLDYGYASALAILMALLLVGVVVGYLKQAQKQELI